PTSHQKLTRPWAVNIAAGIINRYAVPINNRPSVNLTGLDGCRSLSDTHSIENSGVNKITNIGVSDCRKGAGKLLPPISVRTSLSAKRFRLGPFCSYAAQKRIVNTKRMRMAPMRFQSLVVRAGAGAVPVVVLTTRGIFSPTRASVRVLS